MSNVVKFNPKPKKVDPAAPPKPSFWTPERVAWPMFIALVLIVYLVTNSGLLTPRG